MSVHEALELGSKYSKKDLVELLGEDGLLTVREGVFSCKNSDSYFLLVDLEKEGKKIDSTLMTITKVSTSTGIPKHHNISILQIYVV